MDGMSKRENASTKNLFRFYSPSQASSAWIDLLPNNNNNNDEPDENYAPMKARMTQSDTERCDCLPCATVSDDVFVKNADTECRAEESNIEDIDDGRSENNSTGNLSFLSDDGNHGIIGDIILMSEKDICERGMQSEDDSSDDCVYAYRGVDYEPIEVKPEDENDFLEMDFEPDPASEFEQENLGQMNNGSIEIGEAAVFDHSNSTVEIHENVASALAMENGLLPVEHLADSNGLANGRNALVKESNGVVDANTEPAQATSELENKKNNAQANSPNESPNGPTITAGAQIQSKRYTGTIPKTRTQTSLRSFRSKTVNVPAITSKSISSNEADWTNRSRSSNGAFNSWSEQSRTNKRWKIADDLRDDIFVFPSTSSGFRGNGMPNEYSNQFPPAIKATSNAKRSMSFSFEQIDRRGGKCNDTNASSASNHPALHTSQSQNHLFSRKKNADRSPIKPTDFAAKVVDEKAASAVISSQNCSEHEICDALVSGSSFVH